MKLVFVVVASPYVIIGIEEKDGQPILPPVGISPNKTKFIIYFQAVVTVDIYGHLAPEGNKAAVDRLDDDATIRNHPQPKWERGQPLSANPLKLFGSPKGS